MSAFVGRYNAIVSRFSIVERLACLAGVVAIVFALAAPVAYGEHATVGLRALALAAGVTFLGAVPAVVMASLRRGAPAAVAWILAGDAVAMGLPLVVGTVVSRGEGPVAQAGVFGWIVLFFLATLMAKTILIAPLAQVSKPSVADAAGAETKKVGA